MLVVCKNVADYKVLPQINFHAITVLKSGNILAPYTVVRPARRHSHLALPVCVRCGTIPDLKRSREHDERMPEKIQLEWREYTSG